MSRHDDETAAGIERFIAELERPPSTRQAVFVQRLRRGNDQRLPMLLLKLHDSGDPDVGTEGDEAPDNPEPAPDMAVESELFYELLLCLLDRSARVVRLAASRLSACLASFGNLPELVRTPCEVILQMPPHPRSERLQAGVAYAAGRTYAAGDLHDAVGALLESPSELLRVAAEAGFARTDSGDIVPHLLEALRSADPFVRTYAVLGAHTLECLEAMPLWIACLGSPDVDPEHEDWDEFAVRVMNMDSEASAALPVFERFLTHSAPRVRQVSAEGMWRVAPDDRTLGILTTTSIASLRGALEFLRTPQGIRATENTGFGGWLVDSDLHVVRAGAEALGVMSKQSIPDVEEFAQLAAEAREVGDTFLSSTALVFCRFVS